MNKLPFIYQVRKNSRLLCYENFVPNRSDKGLHRGTREPWKVRSPDVQTSVQQPLLLIPASSPSRPQLCWAKTVSFNPHFLSPQLQDQFTPAAPDFLMSYHVGKSLCNPACLLAERKSVKVVFPFLSPDIPSFLFLEEVKCSYLEDLNWNLKELVVCDVFLS